MSSRHEQIGAFYADNAARLERTVARHVNANGTVVEDACAIAWCQLLRRPDIRLGVDGFWWLYRVAVHEAWRLSADERREPRCAFDDDDETTTPTGGDVASLVEDRLRLQSVRTLPERQRRALLMHGCGFTHAEIARMTGDTVRTVERLLGRAKQHITDAGSDGLGAREHDVLEGLAGGLTVAAIAYRLDLSPATVGDYIAALYRKLGVRTRADVIEAFLATNRKT